MFTQVYITYYKWLIEANALQIQVMETRQGKIALTLLNNMVGRSKRTTRVNSSFDGIFNIMYCTDTAALQDRSHFVCMNSGKMEVRLPSHLEKQCTSKSFYLLHWDLFIQYVQLEDFQEDLRDLVRKEIIHITNWTLKPCQCKILPGLNKTIVDLPYRRLPSQSSCPLT